MKKRKLWIDFLRGLVMLIVIWGHIDRTKRLFFVLSGPFKIPLFFAITGYVFNDRKGDVKSFFTNLFFKLVIPWLILSLVWVNAPLALVRKGLPGAIKVVYRVIAGKDFWFMPCCIVAEIIFFFIRKYAKTTSLQYIVMAIVCVVGIVFGRLGIMRFMLVDVACTAQGFILFGYWFKNNEERLREMFAGARVWIPGILFLVFIVLNMTVFDRRTMDIHMNKYFNYPVCAIMSFLSMFFLFLIAGAVETSAAGAWEGLKENAVLKKIAAWVVFVGQNTLVFYILHYICRKVWVKGLRIIGIRLPKGTIAAIPTMIFLCIALSIISVIINTWFPFVVGKKKRRA